MNRSKDLEVLFVAGFGPIARDSAANRAFYSGTLGLPLVDEGDDYLHTDKVSGVKHLACWPLAQAATSCFGKEEWPSNLTIPQGWIEFDVADIDRATAALQSQGYRLLVANREEPWGQVVTRLLGPEGLLVGITYTPAMRGSGEEQEAST